MKKLTIASLVSLVFPAIVCAEPVITLDEDIVVTASRLPQERKAVIGDVSVIEAADIERAGQTTLLELLQTQPGIEVTSNGGAGKPSSLFMRGTNSNHVIVLIDGMRINSETAGNTAFENIPTAQIERVEILRGAASSLYGQDAIGGVIQIFTKKGKDGVPRFHTSAGYGSYNTRTADAGVSGSVGDTSFALNISSYNTDGFSAIKTHNRRYKDDDGYRNLAVSGSLNHQIVPGHSVGIQFFSSEGHNRYDNSSNVTDFSNHNMARQLSYSIFSRNQIIEHWHSTIRIGEGRDDATDYASSGRYYFDTKQRQLSWQNDITLPVGTLTLLYDRLEQRVSSSTQYDQNSRNNDGYAAIYALTHGAHSAQLSYRSDHNSQYGTNDTGNIGYGYQINDTWQVTASYGSAFRAPTFNQLYWPADPIYGASSNPDLKPEKSDNIEASVRYHNQQSSLSATIYENKVHNLIAGYPLVNINRARIQGLTLAGNQQWDAWTLRGNVDVQSPRSDDKNDNLLPLRANRHGSLNLAYQWDKLRIAGEMVSSSTRYAELANTNRLGGYTLFNMVAEYKITPEWRLLARANNIFDKKYALARDFGGEYYNTPGSNVFFSVSYTPQP